MYRVRYNTKAAEKLSWIFLSLAILLFISVAVLVSQLVKGKRSVRELPDVFESEAKNLTCILIFFCSTYFLRFISDNYVVPNMTDSLEKAMPCVLDGYPTHCLSF